MEQLHWGASSEQDKDGTEYMLKGPSYSLNSKQLKVVHLQQIVDLLGLPTKQTVAVTRQLIKGQLMEMDQETKNVQVVSQVQIKMMFCF